MAGHPVWNANITERRLTADLLTEEIYELTDILTLDRDIRFQKKWLVIVDGTQTYSGSRIVGQKRLNGFP